jgi:hypothetical protein
MTHYEDAMHHTVEETDILGGACFWLRPVEVDIVERVTCVDEGELAETDSTGLWERFLDVISGIDFGFIKMDDRIAFEVD